MAGLVLMAGRSSRLGFPKALLPFGDRCLIERVLSQALSSRLAPLILVLGDHQQQILPVVNPFRARSKLQILFNPKFARGMSTSIRKGLEAVNPSAPGVMFLLGDQPLISYFPDRSAHHRFPENPAPDRGAGLRRPARESGYFPKGPVTGVEAGPRG